MTIYEIERGIEECVDEETGEILDYEKLDMLQMEREKKIENIVFLIENTENDIEGLKRQKKSSRRGEERGEETGKPERVSFACITRAKV